jgi:hypothetical protein
MLNLQVEKRSHEIALDKYDANTHMLQEMGLN